MKLSKYELQEMPPIFYREGTSDEGIIAHNIGQNPGYVFPENAEPKVIFDVGANIGVVSVLLANLYPDAKVYAFEPEPGNFEVLLKNVKEYPNVIPRCVALGNEVGFRTLLASDDSANLGGYSFHPMGSDEKKTCQVEVVPIFAEIERAGGTVDMLKIDTEGHEFEILRGIRAAQLTRIGFIIGELHGVKDFETLDLLRPFFHLAFSKSLRKRTFEFYAQRIKQ